MIAGIDRSHIPGCAFEIDRATQRVWVKVGPEGPWLGFTFFISLRDYDVRHDIRETPWPLIEAEIARRRAGALFQPGRHDRGWSR